MGGLGACGPHRVCADGDPYASYTRHIGESASAWIG
jgi:hypothetical protein